jgi:hypothetical protein
VMRNRTTLVEEEKVARIEHEEQVTSTLKNRTALMEERVASLEERLNEQQNDSRGERGAGALRSEEISVEEKKEILLPVVGNRPRAI